MKKILLLPLLCSSIILFSQSTSYHHTAPLSQPQIFAEGIISTGHYESHAAFSPGGDTLYFVKSNPDVSKWTICVSYFKNKKWTTPEVAPFSGQYMDADPVFTPAGNMLYFISNRPMKPGGKVKDDMDIWRMQKTKYGWSEPTNLGETVNTNKSEYYPSFTKDGTMYFGSRRQGGNGNADIYRSRIVNGEYGTPENIGPGVNTEGSEFEPFISPDEKFLVFMAARPDHLDHADLYVSYNKNGSWTQGEKLPPPFNSGATEFSPRMSPDGDYFFFASARNIHPATTGRPESTEEMNKRLTTAGNGLCDIYQVDFSALPIRQIY